MFPLCVVVYIHRKMLAFGPKKDGGPNVKFFESPETLALFDGIKNWLQKNCKKVRETLTCELQSLYTVMLSTLQYILFMRTVL